MTKILIYFSITLIALTLQSEVKNLRLPDGGISPQCITDSEGTAHIVYYKGTPQSGNIFYTKVKKGSTSFQPSVRVNSQPGSAVAMGTIRAAQLAIGKDNSVHVVWNGSQKARGQLLYSKSLNGKQFSPQKDMKGKTTHIDGGGSVAADASGSVYVVWHANKSGTEGERNRRVFAAVSANNGNSFDTEKEISPDSLGICACCSLKAHADGNQVIVLFRGAKEASRDVYQLISKNKARTFDMERVGKWQARQCPMSSQAISVGKNGFLKSWEAKGKILFSYAKIQQKAVPAGGSKKHPVIIENEAGNILVVWAEGTGWNKGGHLCWLVFKSDGTPLGAAEKIKGGVKVWSTVTAFSSGNDFYIIH